MKSFLTCFAIFLFSSSPLQATFNVLRHFRCGDTDPGAIAGNPASALFDAANGHPLPLRGHTNRASYTTDTPSGSGTSRLAVNFSGMTYASSPIGVLVNDNFAVTAWVNSRTTNQCTVVHNGDGRFNGWGFIQKDGVYRGLFGGVTAIGGVPILTNQWTHLALVRDQGTTTFYVNGVPSGTTTAAPLLAAGGWCIAGLQPLATPPFEGLIDEVIAFTFNPGEFTAADLYFLPPPPALSVAHQGTNVILAWPKSHSRHVPEYITELSSTNWTPITSVTGIQDDVLTTTNALTATARYYRLRYRRLYEECSTNAAPIPVLYINRGDPYAVPVCLTSCEDNICYDVDDDQRPDPNLVGYRIGFPGAEEESIQSAILTGQSTHILDASETIDPRYCGPSSESLTYHWQVFWPPGLNGASDESPVQYAVQGFQNVFGPTLVISPSSIPRLDERPVTSDRYWRVKLTIRHVASPDAEGPKETVVRFLFRYGDDSSLTYQIWTTCFIQGEVGGGCNNAAALPPAPGFPY